MTVAGKACVSMARERLNAETVTESVCVSMVDRRWCADPVVEVLRSANMTV